MDVATGPWRDHSLRGWYASMITVDVGTAALIISGLTIFITLVSGRFWAIVVYAMYQLRAANGEKDVLHHQHQLAYRNSSSNLDAIWNIIRIGWAWRRRAHLNVLRTLLFLLPPVICFAGFTAASLFSTKVTTPAYRASRVRVAPRNCGYLNWNSPENYNMNGNLSEEGTRVYGKWWTENILASRIYARSCYTNRAVDSPSCNVLPVQQFQYTTSETEPCPFAEKRCLLGQDTSFRMITPWLDSHEHFGINAPPNQRVSIRRSATCSVLNVNDLTAKAPGSSQGSNIWYYFLGSSGLRSPNSPTYEVSDTNQNSNFPFKILSYTAVAYEQNSIPGWQPIFDFNRTDADVSLFVLNQNSMIHPFPVDDPFFAAHRKQGPAAGIFNNNPFYTADNITTFMACAEQLQLLNNANNVTTALSSSIAIWYQRHNIGLSEVQSETAWRVLSPVYLSLMGRGMYTGQGEVLRASQSAFYTFMSERLPDTQWQVELQGWFEEALASHQLLAVSFASKNMEGLSPYAQVLQYNASSITNGLCKTQLMRNHGGYQTFSVLGLGLILSFGVAIALRIAFGGLLEQKEGVVEWEKLEGVVPVTKDGTVTFDRVLEEKNQETVQVSRRSLEEEEGEDFDSLEMIRDNR
ncbi:hypothetical protein QBC43DRAFT_341595 [Cladorrhinum sp. PSN259]|nr:hypothetical protein QBC43DRAFT_341595 [Cladorrhinum sp. PSN259]